VICRVHHPWGVGIGFIAVSANASVDGRADVALWQILLQKSLATLLNNDSVALMRFAVEAIDDGAAQSRPR
jgi:hypothetical protein